MSAPSFHLTQLLSADRSFAFASRPLTSRTPAIRVSVLLSPDRVIVPLL